MKNFTLLAAVWTLSALFVQLHAQLNYLSSHVARPDRTELNQYFSDYQLYSISIPDLENYLRTPDAEGQLNLFLGHEHEWSMRLSADELRSPEFKLNTLTPSGMRTLPNIATPTFRGTTSDGGKVCLTIYKTYLSLWIKIDHQEYFLESAARFDKYFSANIFVLYKSTNVLNDAPGRCASTEMHETPREKYSRSETESSVCRRAEIAVASDYSMVQDLGGIVTAHLQALQIISLVNADWNANDFDDDISFVMTEHLISTCADCDPWTDSRQAGELLTDFRDWAVADGFSSDHDLGQFWTARNLCTNEDCAVVGLATLSSICTSSPYHLLEKSTNTSALLRSLASHEIGHNFSLRHNYEINDGCDLNGRIPYIMDPVNQIASDWSDGTLDCDINNVASLGFYLPGLDCVDPCLTNDCPPIGNLIFTEQTDSTVSLSWTANTSGNYRAILRDVVDNNYLDTIVTTVPSVNFGPILQSCGTYQVFVQSQCANGSTGELTNLLFTTDATNDLEITKVQIADCSGLTSTYDLQVTLIHNGGNGDGFRVIMNADTSTVIYPYGNSPRQLDLTGLTANGNMVDLTVIPVTARGKDCISTYRYVAPLGDCSLTLTENFNDGWPAGWEVNTNKENLSLPYRWSWGGRGRFIQSYRTRFDSIAATIDATIDSTNMVYFDDDVIDQPVFSGTTDIRTPEMDMRQFANLTLEFDYMFDRVDNPADPFVTFGNKPVETNSYFAVEVYDGLEWQEVFSEASNTCDFFSVWKSSCINSQSLDVSAYRNAEFRVRFVYSDGETGNWAGMVALDNVIIRGNFDVSLPVTLTEFTGRKKGAVAELTWRTETEWNNDYFTLERAADGRNFRALKKIEGQGTTSSFTEYLYKDPAPLNGLNYYRLQQTDFDGTNRYVGEIVALRFNGGALTIRPNPVNGNYLNFNLPKAENNLRTMRIHNSSGQLVTEQILQYPGTTSILVDHLENGIYFLSVQTQTVTETQRFVIIR